MVKLPGCEADAGFLKVILAEEKRTNNTLPIDTLIALARLAKERRIETIDLARAIQRDESAARNVLERLVEAGLIEAHGIKKGRTYTLSPDIYRELGQTSQRDTSGRPVLTQSSRSR